MQWLGVRYSCSGSMWNIENTTFPSIEYLIVSRKSFLNSIPWDVAGALLGISTLLTLPKLASLRDLINIRCIRTDPQSEIADLQTNIETVVKRNDATLVESFTESSVQVVFQWGSYMCLSFLIGKIGALEHISNQHSSEVSSNYELRGFQTIISELEANVALRQDLLFSAFLDWLVFLVWPLLS